MKSTATDNQRLASAEQRVAEASQSAFELALDAIYDTAVQKALFERNDRIVAADEQSGILSSIYDYSQKDRETFLIALMCESRDPRVRDAAVTALTECRSRRAGGAMIALLADPEAKTCRLGLLKGLITLKTTIDLGLLVKVLSEEDVEAQYECLMLLESGRFEHTGRADVRHHIAFLQRLLDHPNALHRNYFGQIIEVLNGALRRMPKAAK